MRDPVLDFIVAFAQPLKKISPHFLADPRANGGSLLAYPVNAHDRYM